MAILNKRIKSGSYCGNSFAYIRILPIQKTINGLFFGIMFSKKGNQNRKAENTDESGKAAAAKEKPGEKAKS